MEVFVARMLEEKDLLKYKIKKIDLFKETETFQKQSSIEKTLLIEQQLYMQLYLNSLEKRLNYYLEKDCEKCQVLQKTHKS